VEEIVDTPELLGRADVLTRKIDRLFQGPFTDRQGRFNYVEWAKVLRVNDGEMESENALAM
jgi:myosin regulatory light chain 12